MSKSQTTPLQAMIDASGHTEADSALILSELNKGGWMLVKFTMGSVLTAAPSREAPKGYTIA